MLPDEEMKLKLPKEITPDQRDWFYKGVLSVAGMLTTAGMVFKVKADDLTNEMPEHVRDHLMCDAKLLAMFSKKLLEDIAENVPHFLQPASARN